MKIKFITSALCSLLVTLAVSGPAQAAMIAGWDFSQYFGPGELSVDGATYTNVLDANYSNLVPAPGAGPGAGVYGDLFFNGQFGSTNVDPSTAALVTAASGSLTQNINAPATAAGFQPFDSLTVLTNAGQTFANELSFQVQNPVSFVFAAYMGSVPGLGSDWSLSFAGQTSSGTSVVIVDFSSDGQTYVSGGQRTLNSVDSLFTVALTGLQSNAAYVRLTFDTAGGLDTRIDNVALNGTVPVPEPGVAVLLGAALAGFALIGRRRSA